MTERSNGWTSWAPYVAILVLAPLLFYAQMVFLGWEPPAPDTQAAAPFGVWGKAATVELGRAPSWYPYIFSGMPSYGSFLFTPRSAVNPLAWLLAPLADHRGARYVLFFVVAGISTCALVRRQGASRLASTAAGLFFAFTPYFTGVVAAGHATKLEALCLTPLFLLAFDHFLGRATLVTAVALGVSGALLLWAHHPQIAYYAFLLAVLYGATRLATEVELRQGLWPARIGGLVLAVIVAGFLVSEPYLAILEYAPFSIRGGGAGEGGMEARGAGWEYATNWSFHPAELITFLFPGWYGLEGRTYWGLMPFTQSSHYFGLVALVLAGVGFFARGVTRRWLWLGLSLFVVFVGFGRHLPVVFGPMFTLLPYFDRFRVPSMIYSLLPLVLAPLVAAGIDALGADTPLAQERRGTKSARASRPSAAGSGPGGRLLADPARWVIALAVCWVVAFALLAASREGMISGTGFLRDAERARASAPGMAALQTERFELLRQSVLFGLGSLVLLAGWLALARRRAISRPVRVAGVALLCVLDVVVTARHFYQPAPRVEPGAAMPIPGAVAFLQQQEGPFRILPVGELFGSNAFGFARLESVGGYQPAKLRVYQDLLDDGKLTAPGILRALDVRYVVAESQIEAPGLVHSDGGFVYELPATSGRAWAVPRAVVVPERDAVLGRMQRSDFDPSAVAVFASGDAPSTTEFARARVTVDSVAPGHLELSVDAEGPALVVVSEIWYPPAWRARVDGASARLFRADHALHALEVPAGMHRVTLTTEAGAEARGRRLARLGAGLAIVAAAAGVWLDRRRARAPAGAS